MAGLIIVLILFVLTIVSYIQIITKAGYSPWWILLPLSLPVLWLIATADVFHGFSGGFGTFTLFDPQGIADQEKALGWLILLDIVANYAMLLALPFRTGPSCRPPGRGTPLAAAPAEERAPSPAAALGSGSCPGPIGGSIGDPSVLDFQGQPAGWYKSGSVGAANRAIGTARPGRRSGSGAVATGWTSRFSNRSRRVPKGPHRRPTEQHTSSRPMSGRGS